MDELHLEIAGLDRFTGFVGKHFYLGFQIEFFQLLFDQTDGEPGAVDGGAEILHGIGDTADVIFMTVGDEHTADLILVFHQIGCIGNDGVDAVHIIFGEPHAAVHNDDISAVFQYGQVLADLIEAAQRDDFQFFTQVGFTPNIKFQSKRHHKNKPTHFVEESPVSPLCHKTPCAVSVCGLIFVP